MAIKRFIVTGDVHSQVEMRISNIIRNLATVDCGIDRNEIAVIILGDAGLNFYLNEIDEKKKKILATYGIRIYCVRGNHEERPENLGYELAWDDDVMGEVYYDPINSEIRYFKDGGIYNIEGYRTLVIGGAYSVDKGYRLAAAGLTEATNDPKKSGWFKDELLTKDELSNIACNVFGQEFDFVFSHTCPLSWEPRDLFLGFVDQSSVDKSMEQWLNNLKDNIKWGIWLWGHYHSDRIERPHCEMYYQNIEDLKTIQNRWFGEKTFKKEWWLQKGPNFYMKDNPWAEEI